MVQVHLIRKKEDYVCVYIYIYIYICMWNMTMQSTYPDSKVHGANMGLIWGRQDPAGPHVGPHELCYLG